MLSSLNVFLNPKMVNDLLGNEFWLIKNIIIKLILFYKLLINLLIIKINIFLII